MSAIKDGSGDKPAKGEPESADKPSLEPKRERPKPPPPLDSKRERPRPPPLDAQRAPKPPELRDLLKPALEPEKAAPARPGATIIAGTPPGLVEPRPVGPKPPSNPGTKPDFRPQGTLPERTQGTQGTLPERTQGTQPEFRPQGTHPELRVSPARPDAPARPPPLPGTSPGMSPGTSPGTSPGVRLGGLKPPSVLPAKPASTPPPMPVATPTKTAVTTPQRKVTPAPPLGKKPPSSPPHAGPTKVDVVSPALDTRRGVPRPAATEPKPPAQELRLRFERLQTNDPVGAARALVELGIFEERVNHDRSAARKTYETARMRLRTLQPALVRVRRLVDGKGELNHVLLVLDDELAVTDEETIRADLLAERARVCEALGRNTDARNSYGEALGLVPLHAAALRGLEAVLRRDLAKSDGAPLAVPLAVHIERLAEGYAPSSARRDGDARLAAWLHVERAEVLDSRLRQPDLAQAALERAVSFDASPGPVRDALTRHLILHDAISGLVASLSVEADRERDHERASRLLYAASRFVVDKMKANTEAIPLLSRATARAPSGTPTERRVLTELIRLLELNGDLAAAAEVRQRQLALFVDPEAIVHEHVRLSELYDTLGHADQSASHAQRALQLDPEDGATRERLDRALQRLGRHEERVGAWLTEANSKRVTPARVAAFIRAADIAERHLRRRDDAITYLRAAWSIDPGNTDVFDILSALLSPPAKDPESDPRGVRARIDLYTQAANAAREPARKVGLLEKLVSIWEDELCQPTRAMEELERILEIDPKRRTAILALQRNAERAMDAKRLAHALSAEAALTTEPALQRKLLLRAAEIMAERLGDRDRALAKIEKAIAVDPADPDALRALHRLLEKAGRYDEARKALLKLIARDTAGADAYGLWIEVALLDEQHLRRPNDAVAAYRNAARIKPRHPLPQIEIARLLRETGDYVKLVEVLTAMAGEVVDPAEYARLLFQAAEVQEFALGNDDSALKSLGQSETAVGVAAPDFAVLESMERIHVRHAAKAELVALYSRWLERHPPAAVDHGLRIALAAALAQTGQQKQAVELLEALVAVAPTHVPALRRLEQLHRDMGSDTGLATILRAEADVFTSQSARCGALWELVALEEQVGTGSILEALERIVADAPHDIAAHEAIVRIAGKLVEGVGIPHPAALATRARLVRAIQARKDLSRDAIARACYQIEEAMLLEGQAEGDLVVARNALSCFHGALVLWPESMLAARGLDRLGQRLGDKPSVLTAQLALAKLVDGAELRAGHMVRAAELTADDASQDAQYQALELYEEALQTDADCAAAASTLPRMLATDPARLVDRLGAALERATVSEQIVVLGSEIGRAVLRQKKDKTAANPIDAGVGVAAMRRVLLERPDEISSLMLMSRLLSAQQLWPEARDALLRVVDVASDMPARVAAYFDLAGIYEVPLADPSAAQAALESVLALDSKNRRALERLHQVAVTRGDRALVISVLGQLAEGEGDMATRAEYDLRLADACRDAGDNAGMVRALCDAVVSVPSDARGWTGLVRLYRVETPEGAAGYVKALQQLVDIATARRMPLEPRWLTTMGLLETTVLKRTMDGLAHLQQGVALPNAPPEARVALGQGLVASGRNVEAVQVLRDLLTPDAEVFARITDLSAPLTALESALATDGRVEERLAVEEVRACLGDVKPDRMAWLRARRLAPEIPYPMALAAVDLARLLLPEARSPMIDVSVALAPIAAKALRFELGSLGVASRDRVGPRDGHPTRVLAERIARALGIETFELYLTPTWQGAARVYPGDPAVIVGPTSFVELPEPEQVFALSRLLTRMALGLTWLDELAPEAVDGLLIAALRTVDPQFGVGDLSTAREHAVQGFLPAMQKAIGRRQRKLLEEILPTTSAAYDARVFTIGVRRSEYRIAYVVSGDLVSAIDYLRRFDREISRSTETPRVLLKHPVTNELLRFALMPEAYAERRRLGTIWMPA